MTRDTSSGFLVLSFAVVMLFGLVCVGAVIAVVHPGPSDAEIAAKEAAALNDKIAWCHTRGGTANVTPDSYGKLHFRACSIPAPKP